MNLPVTAASRCPGGHRETHRAVCKGPAGVPEYANEGGVGRPRTEALLLLGYKQDRYRGGFSPSPQKPGTEQDCYTQERGKLCMRPSLQKGDTRLRGPPFFQRTLTSDTWPLTGDGEQQNNHVSCPPREVRKIIPPGQSRLSGWPHGQDAWTVLSQERRWFGQ